MGQTEGGVNLKLLYVVSVAVVKFYVSAKVNQETNLNKPKKGVELWCFI